ncbi:uncharacterized protein LACBIDRAFT_300263 [Laccaria bicolor S238N-H82]|uniref:Predicted protein n=1 Tax=Laccaria bicolor (strain S238N-H82 / ATCC MYA-4686) TaxID=486041 RepID=B0DGC4_LACBS|nr:uncharacterized protein LACBIDRAFT_300263 [Laccaria bicolor S238N-H82]EDR06248.1 predicted protein [Laccaria bicolor S238N-H82]|eukprot:XP_001883109.1 predicted protein [Laccaria bicolor S238N-H82]
MSTLRYEVKYKIDNKLGPISCLAFSAEGQTLAVGSHSLITLWDMDTGRSPLVYDGKSEVTCLEWGPNNTLYCGYESGFLTATKVDVLRQEWVTVGYQASTAPLTSISVHQAGTHLAIATDGGVGLWVLNSASGDWQHRKTLESPAVNDVGPVKVTSLFWPSTEVSNINTIIISYAHHGVIVWSLEPQEQKFALSHLRILSGASLSADGKLFAVSNMQQGFDVYSIESGVHVRTFREHDCSSETQPFPALFIQGGKWLLGGGIGKATIWHVGSGTQVQVLLNDGELTHPVQHLAATYHCAAHGERFQIATASDRGRTISLWRAQAIGTKVELPYSGAIEVRRHPRVVWKWVFSMIIVCIAGALYYIDNFATFRI